MKTVLNILGSLWCLVSLTGHAQQQPYTLAFADNPPFTLSENGKHSGVAINVISQVFDRTKIAYKLQPMPLARGMRDAKDQDLFCVFPVQRSQAIEADYQWVSPIFITSSGLFVNQDSKANFSALVDAKKLTIGVLRGSGDAEYLKGLGYTVEEVNSPEQNVGKLQARRIGAWATDVLSAQYFIQKSDSKDIAPKEALIFRRSLGSLACNSKVPKADMARLQKTIDAMIKDGSLTRLTAVARSSTRL